MSYADKIVAWSRRGGSIRRRFAQYLLVILFSFDLPEEVEVGNNVRFMHNCMGSVLHHKVVIEDNAWIYHGVTFGQVTAYNGAPDIYKIEKIVVGEGATICAGAKILCKDGVLEIGKGAVVGANAVLSHSIPPYEIWAGIPAKKVGINPVYLQTEEA